MHHHEPGESHFHGQPADRLSFCSFVRHPLPGRFRIRGWAPGTLCRANERRHSQSVGHAHDRDLFAGGALVGAACRSRQDVRLSPRWHSRRVHQCGLLLLVALGLFWEAFERFLHPVAVQERWMIALSLLALGINGGITLGLVRGRRDLNIRALLISQSGRRAFKRRDFAGRSGHRDYRCVLD